jgi:hypothetical protein
MDQAVRFREILRKLAMIDETIRGESRAGAGHADRPIDRPLAADECLARVTPPIVQEACE